MKTYNQIIKKTSELIPYVNNARIHSEQQIKQIASSIREFGFTNPILIDEKNNIIAGHGRLKACELLQIEEVPCINITGLSKAQIKALIIADNRIAENSAWDEDLLAIELEELKNLDFNHDELFNFDDIDLNVVDESKEDIEDDVPEVVEDKIVIKQGDLIELGKHRLLCGDSTVENDVNKLMNGKKANMVFTDPPYGYKYKSNHQTKHAMLQNDDKILNFIPFLNNFLKKNSVIYLFTSHQVVEIWKKILSKNFQYKNLIVWKKNNWSMGDLKSAFAGQHELILFAIKGKPTMKGKRDTDVWEFDRVSPDLHPTIKPVDLITFAISKWDNNLVLDLFLGSGSTLIACEKLNRVCYGMELSEKYCQVVIERYLNYTDNQIIKINGNEVDWFKYKNDK